MAKRTPLKQDVGLCLIGHILRGCFSEPDRKTRDAASDSRERLMHAVLQGNY